MNHDILYDILYSALMSIYKNLHDEYKNEEIAKSQVLKIAKEVLVNFGMKGDLYKTYDNLVYQYKQCSDEQKKYELYHKIETLRNTIEIIKEANSIGK